MSAEYLISLVREYPELYDKNHENYTDSKAKERIWIDIGNKMNQSREYWDQ